MYLQDKRNQFQTQNFVDSKILPELYDLVEKYEPEIIWSDGEWESSSDYWKAREFLNWYGNQSTVAKTAVYNDRWGNDTLCKHGGYLTCLDRYMPTDGLPSRKWENSYTIDATTYGFNRNTTYQDYYTVKELIVTLVQTVSLNGNLLLNVGPNADGTIAPIFVDRLLGIGEWLQVNGDAIYSSKPWVICQNETEQSQIYYTTGQSADADKEKNSPRVLYALFAKWPRGNILEMSCPVATDKTRVSMLGLFDSLPHSTSTITAGKGNTESITTTSRMLDRSRRHLLNFTTGRMTSSGTSSTRKFSSSDKLSNLKERNQLGGMRVQLPLLTPDLVPCQHMWVLAITNLENI